MLKDDIVGTKKIILKQVLAKSTLPFGYPFSKYQKVYAKTNENIAGYLDQENFQDKEKALSVLASGDHVFNLVLNGIQDIDTFDTNKLTYYFSLGLKRAAILKYDYKDYLLFLKKIVNKDTSEEELISVIGGLLPYMSEDNATYWKEILEYNHRVQIEEKTNMNLFRLLLINVSNSDIKNSYLQNQENYNKMRKNLAVADIRFKCADCLGINDKYKSKYDLILLSNIADYFYKSWGLNWTYDKLSSYESSLKSMLTEQGDIFLAYLSLFGKNKDNVKTRPIISSNVTTDELRQDTILTFPHIDNGRESKHAIDGMVLVKK